MLKEINEAKWQVEKVGLENEELMNEPITTQTMETVAEKGTQVKYRVEDISSRFHELEKLMQEAHTT
jgi:hypothetical protein